MSESHLREKLLEERKKTERLSFAVNRINHIVQGAKKETDSDLLGCAVSEIAKVLAEQYASDDVDF